MSIRLLQLQKQNNRRLAFVEEPHLRLFSDIHSSYDLFQHALRHRDRTLADLIEDALGDELLDYDPIYLNQSEWKLLPPFDHPTDPAHCIVSGTGLTHLGSAQNRDDMHKQTLAAGEETLTDSMKMFRWGLQSGKPLAGQIGIAPEWFYKGTGDVLRAHNDPLDVPSFADGGGEEAEIVGLYLIDASGQPIRVAMCQGNEFADQAFEKKNYLNLAGAKLRTCSIGPELVLHPDFTSIQGKVTILRDGHELWSKPQLTGESEMSHALANIEHHLFKFPHHRTPGYAHIHYYGTSGTSFGAGLRLQNNDLIQIHFQNFGRPLLNTVRTAPTPDKLVQVSAIK